MRLRVLGCDGGRGIGYYAIGLLFDDCYLVDAGTVLSALTLDEALRITDVFLTHCHLDHLCELPFLLDATFARRQQPLRIHAQRHTLDAMMTHLFNDVIWPDFSRIPAPGHGQFVVEEIEPRRECRVGPLVFTPIEVNHTVPTVGFMIADSEGCVMFSADTGPMTEFWDIANAAPNLKAVILDLSFPDREHFVADVSGHMTASRTATELEKLHRDCAVYVFHYKVGQAEIAGKELARLRHFGRPVLSLKDFEQITFQ